MSKTYYLAMREHEQRAARCPGWRLGPLFPTRHVWVLLLTVKRASQEPEQLLPRSIFARTGRSELSAFFLPHRGDSKQPTMEEQPQSAAVLYIVQTYRTWWLTWVISIFQRPNKKTGTLRLYNETPTPRVKHPKRRKHDMMMGNKKGLS